MLVLIMTLASGLAATDRIRGFGDTNPSDGIVDGLNLLLRLGYKL